MAARRLQHEALLQKRDAVVALARHAARNAVRRQLQAQGVKVALVPLSMISQQANAYLRSHAAELFAQAEASPIVQNSARPSPSDFGAGASADRFR
jgi:hypothetical protein